MLKQLAMTSNRKVMTFWGELPWMGDGVKVMMASIGADSVDCTSSTFEPCTGQLQEQPQTAFPAEGGFGAHVWTMAVVLCTDAKKTWLVTVDAYEDEWLTLTNLFHSLDRYCYLSYLHCDHLHNFDSLKFASVSQSSTFWAPAHLAHTGVLLLH